jgi:hypothetical protein
MEQRSSPPMGSRSSEGPPGNLGQMIIRETQDEPEVVSVQRVVKLLAAEGWLQHFERVDDLGQDDRWAGLSVSSN